MSPMIIDEVLAQPQDITWLPWAVQYFFFIGIASCAVLLACAARWSQHRYREAFERICLFLALTCGIVAPLALTADLHQTARFWHFYAWPTPWSWMPWGALFLPLFTVFVGLWFLLFHLRVVTERFTPLMRWIALAAALTAVGLLLYTGREVSVVQARPIWFSYGYPLVMFISAISALLALLSLALHKHRYCGKLLAKGQVVTLLLLGAVALVWLLGDTLSGEALRQQWRLATDIRFYMLVMMTLWGVVVVLALAANRYDFPLSLTLASTLLVAALCWTLRWALLIGGQTVPKYNALINDYHLPPGTDGLLAIIGTFGLWFALMITIRECVNWLSRRFRHV
ncbi:tetrathionate reductase subunit TtrC [Phytobacter diazotrophicus]|uniref:tetrathionate reductase subunit TtrC n=2 Tax=Phytobacter diazotrophicus TaxID=395631 RepID=UPI00232C516B|nr:tetrathionate reductase subunit TtrC [Phytobacter diazotrophicus]MDC0726269.1 tetrathionate reductase subunit TtrC [Phytobacter diazotrophicus]MDC0736215.1 tetrathionate reductase subunit TtrC [Phytobacter diazotrophicus]